MSKVMKTNKKAKAPTKGANSNMVNSRTKSKNTRVQNVESQKSKK